MKSETCKIYSRVFWILLPNIVKIDLYNSELHRFKVGAFWGHRVDIADRLQTYSWSAAEQLTAVVAVWKRTDLVGLWLHSENISAEWRGRWVEVVKPDLWSIVSWSRPGRQTRRCAVRLSEAEHCRPPWRQGRHRAGLGQAPPTRNPSHPPPSHSIIIIIRSSSSSSSSMHGRVVS